MKLFRMNKSFDNTHVGANIPQIDWLNHTSFFYLLIPFVLFCLTWLKLPIGLSIVLILGWLGWKNRTSSSENTFYVSFSDHKTWMGIILLGIWVFLSGIGGGAFQNQDHHTRNAIFRDLVNYDWPVIYSKIGSDTGRWLLVYYIGSWLPSALIGKVGGWSTAELSFYLWTWAGTCLVALQISKRLKWPLLFAALLFIFFSGMDALGVVFMRGVVPDTYPTLWPPLQHLEWWAPKMQYSSFTTQLFWVFNQAVPAWLCVSLLINSKHNRLTLLIWSLCFFYAPLPFLGLFPLVAWAILNPHLEQSDRTPNLKSHIHTIIQSSYRNLVKATSFENVLGGGIIFIITFLYFSVNHASNLYGFFGPDQIVIPIYLVFILLEGGLLWFILLPLHKQNVQWVIIGAIIFIFPWIKVGISMDFCMRASIPALFYLMIAAGEGLTKRILK